jgi:hypothetical protein
MPIYTISPGCLLPLQIIELVFSRKCRKIIFHEYERAFRRAGHRSSTINSINRPCRSNPSFLNRFFNNVGCNPVIIDRSFDNVDFSSVIFNRSFNNVGFSPIIFNRPFNDNVGSSPVFFSLSFDNICYSSGSATIINISCQSWEKGIITHPLHWAAPPPSRTIAV